MKVIDLIRTSLLVITLILLGFFVFSGNLIVDYAQSREVSSPFEDSLNAAIQYEMADKDLPSLVLTVIQDQQVRYETGFGYADPRAGIEATPFSVFQAGELSQLFTTIAFLQRVEQEKANLDIPVSAYLPEFRPDNSFGLPITFRQILSHQSGLPAEPRLGHRYDVQPQSIERIALSLNQSSVVYPPETFGKYSNAGIAIAGYFIEREQEKPFEQHMRAVLDRMNLERTSFKSRIDLVSRLATGHMEEFDGKRLRIEKVEVSNTPALGALTTINDMGIFIKVLFADGLSEKGSILKRESLEEMWTVQLAPVLQPHGFGLGFLVSAFDDDARRFYRAGSFAGFSTRVDALPDSKTGVALMTTVEHADAALERLAAHVFRLIRAEELELPLPAYPRTGILDRDKIMLIRGQYSGEIRAEIRHQQQEAYLFLGQRPLRLRQMEDSLVVDDRTQYGPVVQADGYTIQYGNTRFIRQDRRPPSPGLPQLSGLTGRYLLSHREAFVFEEEGSLHVHLDASSQFQLSAVDDTTFKLPDLGPYSGEYVFFSRDEGGVARAITLANMRFERDPLAGSHTTLQFYTNALETESNIFQAGAVIDPPSFASTDTSAYPFVDLITIDPLLELEILYATPANPMGKILYPEPRALLREPVATALFEAQSYFRRMGLGIVIHDTYQPWQTSQDIIASTPDSLRYLIQDPANNASRGCSVGLSLYRLETGERLNFPTQPGTWSPLSHPDYPDLPQEQKWNRDLLRLVLEPHGFDVHPNLWWTFKHQTCPDYQILDHSFEEISESLALGDPVRIFTLEN